MVTRQDVKKLFDLAEIEEKEEQLRQKILRKEELEAEQKEMMIEYLIEHLNPRALIAVHLTDHFPENGILKPTGHYLFNFFKSQNAKKIIEDLQLKHPRITIHFALNCPVTGVAAEGGWVKWKGKYAILIPISDFLGRIKCLNPVDTWIIGDLELTDSAEILMNEAEYFANQETWDALRGKAKIVPFPENSTLHESIRNRIRIRGYKLMEGGDYDWYQEQDLQHIAHFINESKILSSREKDRLVQLLAAKGYKVWIHVFEDLAEKLKKASTYHKKTDWRKFEKWLNEIYQIFFNPTDYELSQPAAEFSLKVLAFGQAKLYKEWIIRLIDSGEYNMPHEKEYLEQLRNTLDRFERWLEEINHKFESTHNTKTITWEEFLRREKII